MKVRVGLMLAITALSGLAWAAPAAASESECLSNRVCLFGNNDFDWLLSMRGAGYGNYNLISSVNDKMDSWINRTGTNAAGYSNANGSGDCQTFHSNSKDNNVNFANSDEVSSWKTNGGC
ncbi:peptidase inhibitor family I36 protein [Paractinoplanes maris]|uniref:peptidase inhibitor family I36 protein n=1 Tax=Paractinoplanes maris TaxID=1734446 RepID=UPI002020962A|nr:peptidase inhibitor family I36 protein [Actinoplanes maris]